MHPRGNLQLPNIIIIVFIMFGKYEFKAWAQGRGVGGTPYNSLYREASPEAGVFFRLKACEG